MEPNTVLISETYKCELLGTVAVLGAHATKIAMFPRIPKWTPVDALMFANAFQCAPNMVPK